MSNQDRARNLGAYFRDQIERIAALRLDNADDSQLDLYRKTLLVTVLDCLAGIRFDAKNYPNLSGQNRRRFTRLVRDYGNWPLGERVSTPFLSSRLSEMGLTGPLSRKIEDHLAKFDPNAGGSESIESMDFRLEELKPLARKELEESALELVQHWSLLYRYRNHLVHEFREPGYGMKVFAEDTGTACYHSAIGDTVFFLVYPVALFQDVASAALDGVERYFLEQALDPYDRVSDTTRW